MKSNRTKNATRNIFSGLINKAVTLLVPFLLRTIMIKVLGSEYLGLNSLFTAILQVLNLAELGFNTAIVFSMYKPIAEDDKTTICALMNFYKKVYRTIGICVLVVGVALMPFLRYLIKGSHPADVNLYILYAIYLTNAVLSYFLFAYKNALLNAHQRSDITSNIKSIIFILQYAFQICAIIIFKNYYIYIILQPIFTIANNLVTAYITNKKYPEYICKGSLSKDILGDIKKKVGGLMIQKVCVTTRNSLDSIIISSFLGLNFVTMYDNYYFILKALHSVLDTIHTALDAGIGNSIALDTPEKNHNDMHKFMFIYAWASGICTICMACIYQPFMKLWAGESLLLEPYIMLTFCAYFYAMTMGDVRNIYTTGAGLWWESRYRSISESITNLILNVILGYFFGLIGVVLATLISILVINFGYGSHIVFKYYFKNGKLNYFFARHGLYAAVTFGVGALTYFLCNFIGLEGIVGILIRLVICLIIPNILFIIIYCRSRYFKDSLVLLRNVLNIITKRKAA